MTIDYTKSNAQGEENKIVNLGLTKVPFPNITGLTLAADVHFKHPDIATELTFNTIDTDGLVWVITNIENWWNMPEPEIPDIARGLDDGSYDVRGRWRAKNITLSGSILVPDASKTAAARQKLMEYFNIVYTGGWLIVDESPYRKASYVRLVGQPTIDSPTPRGRINFTIPLKAGDPLKYSWDRSDTNGYTYANTISSNTITNNGNYQVAGVFDLVGPIEAPASITAVDSNTNTTQTLTITTSLRANTYTTGVTYTEFSGGTAIITANAVANASHGFFVGDRITVANAGTRFNVSNAAVTAVTASTISYENPISNVTSISHSSNIASVTTAASHGLSAGNTFYIKGSSNPIFDGSYTVLASPSPTSNTFSYTKTAANQGTGYGGTLSPQLASTILSPVGSVTLAVVDTMKIDTYNNTVTYRGLPDESRGTLAVNVDWIKIKPGNSLVTFSKISGAGTCSLKYRSGWIG